MSTRPYLLVVFIASLVMPATFAQREKFTAKPDQSEVTFSLTDVLHSVHGTFHVESGTVEFDLKDPQMSGVIVVAAGSGNSGSDKRDHRMNTDILNTARFPEATFTPRHANGLISAHGDSTVQVDGVFTLHGTPHNLTVPMQIHIERQVCTAKTHFAIPYVSWGLKDPSTFILRVGKEVAVDVTLVGRISALGD